MRTDRAALNIISALRAPVFHAEVIFCASTTPF